MGRPLALVLGGSSDIGRRAVKLLAARYEVLHTYCSTPPEIKKGAVRCDLRSEIQVRGLFKQLKGRRLSLFVTAAFPYMQADGLDFEGYQRAEPFLRAHVLAMCLASKQMARGGKIINVLGQSADHGIASAAHYAASFAYIDNISKSVNSSHGRRGLLSIHNILLGPTRTRLWRAVSGEGRRAFEEKVVRFLRPEQVAREILHIALSEVGPTKLVLDGFYSL